MMYIKKNGKVHLCFRSKKEKALDTKVSKQAQKEYKQKCKELKMKYKPISDAPEHYKSFDDENGNY